MSKLRSALLAALCGGFAMSCTAAGGDAVSGTVTSAPALPLVHVSRVVLVSIDGLRGDALAGMPTLSSLRAKAVWTDSMLTITPSLTVPGHLALFTGRDVSQLGVVSNVLDQSTGLALALSKTTTIFQWARTNGGTATAVAGTALIPQTDLATAQSFFGVDTIISVTRDLALIRDNAVQLATSPRAPTVLFVHIPTVDFAGHDFGWIRPDTTGAGGHDVLGTEYINATASVDSSVAVLWRALSPAIDSGTVALVVTADHGGGHGEGCVATMPAYREHCTADLNDRTIPFLLIAKGLTSARLAGTPRITQIAPTLAGLLRLTPPSFADTRLQF